MQKTLKQIYLNIDEILTDTTLPARSRLRSNGNKRILHTAQISATGASVSDAVYNQNVIYYYPGTLSFWFGFFV